MFEYEITYYNGSQLAIKTIEAPDIASAVNYCSLSLYQIIKVEQIAIKEN